MKPILVLIGVIFLVGGAFSASTSTHNVCEEVSTGELECCEGWTGSVNDGCPTPVCAESCELYGGTCQSPDNCVECPDHRFGDDCEKSQCQQEREDHQSRSWLEQRETLKPECLRDGSYALLQCHHVTEVCHCVDRYTGLPYIESFTTGVPDCSKYYVDNSPLFSPKEVRLIVSEEDSDEENGRDPAPRPEPHPCNAAHEKWRSSGVFSMFRDEPNCAEDGYYVIKRCDYFWGYCVCVDRHTGIDIEYTREYDLDIDCDNVPMPEPEPPAPRDDSHPEEGCVRNDVYYEPNKSYYDDCNLCVCHGHDVIQCTIRDCTTDSCHLGENNKIVDHIYMGHCHRCMCNHGVYTCTMADCDELDAPGEMDDVAFCDNKPPRTHYQEECNDCYCSERGISHCTEMDCYDATPGCHIDLDFSRFIPDGEQIKSGCDTFRCEGYELVAIQTCADTMVDMVLTEDKPETACKYEGEDFYNGESMLLGYRMCKCEKFSWNCQLMMEM